MNRPSSPNQKINKKDFLEELVDLFVKYQVSIECSYDYMFVIDHKWTSLDKIYLGEYGSGFGDGLIIELADTLTDKEIEEARSRTEWLNSYR